MPRRWAKLRFHPTHAFTNVPAVVSRALPGFDMAAEQSALQHDVRALLDQATEPLYYIIDLTQTTLSFNDILRGSSGGARAESSPWRHSNIRGVIFVSADEIIHRAVAGLDSAAFGHFKAVTVNTLEEAINHINRQV